MNQQSETTNSWVSQLVKQAATQEANRDDIAEAFASQAYTAVENRAGLIMTDPYLLGFEVIERNEANNRLVGAFAFRIGQFLVLTPVFFLNGKIKGQYLLYNKTKDEFIPNNKTQIRAIIAESESSEAGKPVDRDSSRGAVMEFDSRSLAAPHKRAAELIKQASQEDHGSVILENLKFPDELREEILGAWKQACATAQDHEKVATRHIFREFLVNNPGFEKKAAELAESDQDFAEGLVISRALQAAFEKKASAAAPVSPLTLHVAIPDSHEKLAAIQGDLFKRGYAIEDTRPEDDLLDAFRVGATDEYLRTSPNHGVDFVLDANGDAVKVLVAPVAGREGTRKLLILEGDDKGKSKDLYSSDRHGSKLGCGYVFSDNTPTIEPKDDFEDIGVAKPKKGKHYQVFCKSLGKFTNLGRLKVEKVSTDGPVVEVDTKWDGKIILRSDIEETSAADANPGHRDVPTLGADAVWIECSDIHSDPALLKADKLFDFVINKSSRGKVRLGKTAGIHYLSANRKRVEYPTAAGAAMKLASLGLPAKTAMELVDMAENETVEFEIIPPLSKVAAAWYEREPDPENDFIPYGRDPDLGIAVDDMSGVPLDYPVRRNMPTMEESRYLDAAQPVQTGGVQDHLPDDVLLNMSNPAQELSQTAQDSGFDHLIDHGALGSLVKTFDAVPLAISYIPDLAKGVDRLGRIIFLLLWKPSDFAERFGENDMPHLENTLVSAFEKHGDLVLELRQSTGNE